MNKEVMGQNWNGLGDEVISGMLEWRMQHPKAPFREIEKEVGERLGERHSVSLYLMMTNFTLSILHGKPRDKLPTSHACFSKNFKTASPSISQRCPGRSLPSVQTILRKAQPF
jgi:hypothetical protein